MSDEQSEMQDQELELEPEQDRDGATPLGDGETTDCDRVLNYLKRSRGFDFSGYKTASLHRRLQRRLQMINVASCSEYLDYLEANPDEFSELFNTILINVTSFFRDPASWETLQSALAPRLMSLRGDAQFRVWSAGCATGEEPYTIMMILAELIGVEAVRDRVKLYATDFDDDALREARLAAYGARAIEAIPGNLRTKYFQHVNGNYVFNNELRRNVIFGKHDLMNDAPISRVDLLTCRNTMIYFNSEVQERIVSRFHFALNTGGLLMLGKAEMLSAHSNLFNAVDIRRRIFTQVPKSLTKDRSQVMTQYFLRPDDAAPEDVAQSDSNNWRSVFDTLPTSQIVVDQLGQIALINQAARSQFNLRQGDVGRALHELEISYRPVELRSLIDRANRERQIVSVKETPYANIAERKPEPNYVDVQVAPVFDAQAAIIAVLITFTDTSSHKALKDELQEANRELEAAYEELQSTNEELETTNEELQSTNEELETTNEELQSTNEELETMNEELQSTNEELHAINDELRQRSAELNSLNGVMGSILSSLHTGIAVLDPAFTVQVWNVTAEDMWGLRSDEAANRHLLSLDIGLPLDLLRSQLRAVSEGDMEEYQVVLDATNRRGKQVQCKVSLTRLSGQANGPKGVLLMMETVD